MAAEPCEECTAGYLLHQEYGFADIPAGWTPVQRHDLCNRFEGDDSAAEAAARDKGGVAYAFFFAYSEDLPGDYAIEWSEGPDNDDWINRAYQAGAVGNERVNTN